MTFVFLAGKIMNICFLTIGQSRNFGVCFRKKVFPRKNKKQIGLWDFYVVLEFEFRFCILSFDI
ncbi:hypothetical protein JP09_005980 [Dehalogenimonas etheniformans]|uniref:Uncharacterized protein n=1 Tax=Dehalogenimonas etheniformans TaxID=1536648 RepID=A0A2P5P6E2_9CHLR|nr:hypothetical protein JP09_005980 [Dehalogenimonas etheniformans]